MHKTPSQNSSIVLFAFRKSQGKFFRTLMKHCHSPVKLVSSWRLVAISLKGIRTLHQIDVSPACEFAVLEFYAKTQIKIPYWMLNGFFHLLAYFNYVRYMTVFQGNISKVLIWNGGKFRQRIAVEIARQQGIPVCFFENGLLPNTLVFDTKGINFNNSVPREKSFYETYDSAVALPTHLVPRIGKKRDIFKGDKKALPPVYIFVPFQVDYDTQIISQSPWIKNMRMLFDVIEEVAAKSRYHFVFKEHPSSGIEYPDLHERVKTIPNMDFYNTYSTQELIENSIGVITVNSTVGIESLLFGKTVITLGNAFYAIDQIAFHAENISDLSSYVARIETIRPDHELVKRFLKYLYNEYLIHKDGNEYMTLCQRLEA